MIDIAAGEIASRSPSPDRREPVSVEIGGWREADLDVLTDLIRRAFRVHLRQGLRFGAAGQSTTDTRTRLRSGHGLVMRVDGRIAGTATVCPPQPDSPVLLYRDPQVRTLGQFCIDPELAGLGLGARLHAQASQIAIDSGGTIMALDTAAPADGLIRLYQRWGYEIVGTCDWRPFTHYDSVVLARPLGQQAPED